MSQAGRFVPGGGAGTPIETITGNTGGPVGPDGSNNINVVGTNVITVDGDAGTFTETISLTNGTNGQVLIGGGAAPTWATITPGTGIGITNAANSITIGVTGGVPTTFETDSGDANPSADTIVIQGGDNINTAGATNVVTINLDESLDITGNYETTAGNILLPNTNAAGTEGVIEFNSIRFIHNVGTENTFVGAGSGDLSITGSKNTVLGYEALTATVAGSDNIAIGYQALSTVGASADNNIAVGNSTGGTSTGSGNIYIGNSAGSSYTGGEDTNILIGNTGTVGDIGITRIGTEGTQILTYLAGETITDSLIMPTASADASKGTINYIIASDYVPVFLIGLDGTDNPTNLAFGINAGGFGIFTGKITGTENITFGNNAGESLVGGSYNAYVGYDCAQENDGSNNTALGYQAGISLTAGDNNIIVGYQAGYNYSSTESSNILIGNQGVNAESNVLRIGTTGSGSGEQSTCYIAGIDGVNVGSTAQVVTEVSGQLGSAVITPGAGISVTTGANTITIAATDAAPAYTNVHTTPYTVLSTDYYLSVDCSGGAITVKLPNAPSTSTIYIIKDRTGSAGSNNITVTTVGGAVDIDGAVTFVMNTAYEATQVIFNGTSYEIF